MWIKSFGVGHIEGSPRRHSHAGCIRLMTSMYLVILMRICTLNCTRKEIKPRKVIYNTGSLCLAVCLNSSITSITTSPSYCNLVCLIKCHMLVPMHCLNHAPYHCDVQSRLLYKEEMFSQLLPLYHGSVRDHCNHGFDGLGFDKSES